MSALVLFLFLLFAGLFIIFLGTRVHGLIKVLSILFGALSALIGLYGVFTYYL